MVKKEGIKIQGNNRVLVSILVLILIVVGMFVFLRIRDSGNGLGNNSDRCEQDSDCIKRQVSCCPCNMGGEEACVSKNNLSYQDSLKNCPGENELICTAMYNCGISSCSCVNGKCIGNMQ